MTKVQRHELTHVIVIVYLRSSLEMQQGYVYVSLQLVVKSYIKMRIGKSISVIVALYDGSIRNSGRGKNLGSTYSPFEEIQNFRHWWNGEWA